MRNVIFMVFLAFVMTNCATMFSGGSEKVQLMTSGGQEGVEVRVISASGGFKTKIPSEFEGQPHATKNVSITVTDKCYEETTVVIEENLNTIYLLNILNIYGFLWDYLNGNMWDYETPTIVPVVKKNGVEGCDVTVDEKPSA
jgi:hypothetical protein